MILSFISGVNKECVTFLELRSTTVPDTTSRTPEDECKWIFTAIWFILLKQIYAVRHGSRIQTQGYNRLLHMTYVHNDMYSVHKGVLVLCRTRSPCLLTSWRHLHVTSSTISSPAWRAGPPISPTLKMAPLPPGSTHIFVPLSLTITTKRAMTLYPTSHTRCSEYQANLCNYTLHTCKSGRKIIGVSWFCYAQKY
jgi:hypothetical protein